MMQFSEPEYRTPPESIVPMINVVFLLLIFFLMTAEIAPPEPFPVSPPLASSDEQASGEFAVYVNQQGQIAFKDIEGEDAVMAVLHHALTDYCAAENCDDMPTLRLRADGAVPAEMIAAILPRVGVVGFTSVQMITSTN